jgi:meiotically up-regulated gene 157 (Mug157) protein
LGKRPCRLSYLCWNVTQVRTRVLDEEWENTFRRLYPAFRPEGQPAQKAA